MPAYPNQTPDLGKLNFNEIKDSLKSYLKNQDSLKDFNFEGSIMQTLLNVLAYNTYYYAFYANMVSNEVYLDSAQRTDSVVSLTKPLGYFVPFRSSAKATVNVFGLLDDIPEFAQFYGKNPDGLIYSFYTLKSYQQFDSDAENVEIYEGKTIKVDFDVTNSFDEVYQRFFIAEPEIDIRSLKVKVQTNGQLDSTSNKDLWILADDLGNETIANQNIYYLERGNNGLYVLFGKTNSLGRSVNATADRIYISYLTSSGKVANDIVEYSFVSPTSIAGNISIGLVEKSVGGLNDPNLDFVKFVAPKTFSSQNRAVTKDDIKALVSPFFTSQSEYNVFGGEEIFPQMYGRVFFTADLDPNNPAQSQQIQQITDAIRSKCVVTVIPEFVQSKFINIEQRVSFSLTPTKFFNESEKKQLRNSIKNILNSEFDTQGSYNYSFNSEDAANRIKLIYKDVLIEPIDFSIFYRNTFFGGGTILVDLENELDVPFFTNVDITEDFIGESGSLIKLVLYVNANQNLFSFIQLKTFEKQSNGSYSEIQSSYGRVNIKRGIIEINNSRNTSEPITIAVNFKNKYFVSNLNNKIRFRTTSVEYK